MHVISKIPNVVKISIFVSDGQLAPYASLVLLGGTFLNIDSENERIVINNNLFS
jgi:hypothetical protein